MRITRWFLVLALAGFTASTALADGVDPVFTLKGGKHSTPVTDGHFTFTANNTTGTNQDFAFDFINQSGFTALSLELTFLVFPADLIITVDNSGDPFFNNFAVHHAGLGTPYTIDFFGLDETHHGILSQDCSGGDGDPDDCVGGGADFILGINGVPPGAFISGTGSLPEPSTGLSLALGLAGIALASRKLRLV